MNYFNVWLSLEESSVHIAAASLNQQSWNCGTSDVATQRYTSVSLGTRATFKGIYNGEQGCPTPGSWAKFVDFGADPEKSLSILELHTVLDRSPSSEGVRHSNLEVFWTWYFFFEKYFFWGFLWWPNSRSEVPAEGGSEFRAQIWSKIAIFGGFSAG